MKIRIELGKRYWEMETGYWPDVWYKPVEFGKYTGLYTTERSVIVPGLVFRYGKERPLNAFQQIAKDLSQWNQRLASRQD